MFCNNCGHRNPVGANFCSSCGAPLTGAMESTTVTFLPLEGSAEAGEEEVSVTVPELPFGIGVLLAAPVHARSLPHRGGRSRYEVLTG